MKTEYMVMLDQNLYIFADIDHARIEEITTILQDTQLLVDYFHNQEILDLLDPVRIQKQGTNVTQNNHKPKKIQLTSKSRSITHLKQQTLYYLQAGSTLYTHIHHQTKFNMTIHQD